MWKSSSVKQGRISQSAKRREYPIVPELIFAGFLIAKQVNHPHGNALQAFVSAFPDMMFQDPCFSVKDMRGLRGFVGFPQLWRQSLTMLCAVEIGA